MSHLEFCNNPVCLNPAGSKGNVGLCDSCYASHYVYNLPIFGYPAIDDLKVLSKELKDRWKLLPTDEEPILRTMRGKLGGPYKGNWAARPQPEVMRLWKFDGRLDRLSQKEWMPHYLVGRNSEPTMDVVRQAFCAAGVFFDEISSGLSLPKQQRRDLTAALAGQVFMRQRILEERRDGKFRFIDISYRRYQ